ncbi:MAG: 5'/3'-nucleotidase SurE [Armatimonadota bacterium]
MRILITNDDGVHAEGLLALKRALEPVAEVTVVAPDRPRSACGHSITLHKPLRLSEARLADGSRAWCSNGTPSDCVTLALLDVMRGAPPDLIFSGINQGPNLGWDLTYSGTVSAAMEGVIGGVQSVAISVAWRFRRVVEEEEGPPPPLDYGPAAEYAAQLARHLAQHPLPEHVLLNVNVPHTVPNGARITRQGVRRYPGKLEKRVDPMGRAYFWLGGDEPVDLHEEGTDVAAISDGCISVTPIQLDLTDHRLRERFVREGLPGVECR